MEDNLKLVFGILTLFMILIGVSFVSAEMLISDAGVEYEDNILEQFNKIRETNETFVQIIIDIKDKSKTQNIFSIFSEEEIEIIPTSSTSSGIVAKISESGFNKLIQDNRVDKVYYDFPFHVFDGKNILQKIINGVIFLVILIILLIVIFYIIKKKKRKK